MLGELVRQFPVSEARGLGSKLFGLVHAGRHYREHDDYNLPLSHNRNPSAIAHPEYFEIL